MALSEIIFHAPSTIPEVLKLLRELDDAYLLAGGTDLLVDIKEGLIQAQHLISLEKIKELKGIEKKDGKIRIGAMTTLQEVISSPIITHYLPALAEAARSMACTQIRHLATAGGNISSGVPSADLPPPLIAAEASLRLECEESTREVSLLEFFRGPRVTVCQEEELLTSIYVPLPLPETGMSFKKFSRREANALAVASVASQVSLSKRKITKASIVLGAVAPTPVLASKASESLIGYNPSQDLFEKAASLAKEEGSPISDIRGPAWYRKELIYVLAQRSLSESLARAQGNPRRRES